VSNIEPRSPKRLSRKQRETRAFQLLVAGSALGGVAVIGLLLAVIDVVGAGIPILAGILAVICFMLFRRSVGK
jgi:hypothetical protein